MAWTRLILTHLALLLLQLSEASPRASPVRLPLSNGGFVQLLAGYPGVYLNLQVNTSSDRIELYSPLERRSQSVTTNKRGHGEEVFYFNGDTRLWLPFQLNPLPAKDSFKFYPAGDGSLGLGRHSPLFRFWENFTLNSRYLYLGYYDQYSQLDYDEHGPVLSVGESSRCQLPDGSECEVLVDTGRMDTYLPLALYDSPPQRLTLLSNNCQRQYHEIGMQVEECEDVETIQLPDTPLTLLNGLSYNATQRHEGREIRIGLHFLEENTLFQDQIRGRQFFATSAFAIAPSGYVALCIVMLAFILMAWATIVTVDNYGSEWTLNLTFMLEFYGYLVCTAVWSGTVFGMRWGRLVANFLRANPTPLLWFVSLTLFACLAGSMWVVSHFELQITLRPRTGRMERNRATARRLKQLRLLFFPTGVLITMWLCVLQFHNALPDIVYPLAFVTALCINASLLACTAYVYSLPYAGLFYTAFVLLYVFLWFTLVPTFNIVDLHYSTLVESISYTVFAVMMPALCLFMKFALANAEAKLGAKKKSID